MDRSAEVVRQDHIQEAMRVKYRTNFRLVQFGFVQLGLISIAQGNDQTEGLIRSNVTPYKASGSEYPAESKANGWKLSKTSADIDKQSAAFPSGD